MTAPYGTDGSSWWLYQGDVLDRLREIPDGFVQTCVTSPPYFGLRDYGVDGQIGAEESPAAYVKRLVDVFAEVRRVLADDGTLWLNLGDSYQSTGGHTAQGSTSARQGRSNVAAQNASKVVSGLPNKSLLGIPWRVAFALQDDGWILRNEIIWAKSNAMPESVTDRFASKHEHVFMFSKRPRYYFDLDAVRVPHESAYSADAIKKAGKAGGARPPGDNFNKQARREGGERTPATRAERAALLNPLGKNPGDVWTISTRPFPEAHFATYPPELPERCILAGSREGDFVLDPFSGSGTTGMVSVRHRRRFLGIDLNAEYLDLSMRTRLRS